MANKALARKIAERFYDSLVHGMKYVEEGLEKAEKCYTKESRLRLERLAKKLGAVVLFQAPEASTASGSV